MKKLLVLCLAAVLVAGVAPASYVGFGVSEAQAQQGQQRRPNLLELLFGGALRKQRLQRQRQQDSSRARRIIRRDSASGSRASAPRAAARNIVQKNENAARILVVGDFMANGLHWGLQQAYAENPDVVFVDKASGLSGIVRDDVVNWPERIAQDIEETKPVAVIVLVGMNDRQQMRLASGRVAKLSDGWKAAYDQRVETMAKAVRDRNLPLIWLGLPPVKSGSMNADYLVFNEVYRTKVEAVGGAFVDVWDGYTNAEGQFVSAGPDINGQIVRLRNSDGINMTRAGKRKLAFYAQREIRRLTGIGREAGATALTGVLGAPETMKPEYDPVGTGKTIVIALDSPQADGGLELEGDRDFLEDKDGDLANSYQLVVSGTALAHREGRIDAGWGVSAPKEEDGEKTEDDSASAETTPSPDTARAAPPTDSQIAN